MKRNKVAFLALLAMSVLALSGCGNLTKAANSDLGTYGALSQPGTADEEQLNAFVADSQSTEGIKAQVWGHDFTTAKIVITTANYQPTNNYQPTSNYQPTNNYQPTSNYRPTVSMTKKVVVTYKCKSSFYEFPEYVTLKRYNYKSRCWETVYSNKHFSGSSTPYIVDEKPGKGYYMYAYWAWKWSAQEKCWKSEQWFSSQKLYI